MTKIAVARISFGLSGSELYWTTVPPVVINAHELSFPPNDENFVKFSDRIRVFLDTLCVPGRLVHGLIEVYDGPEMETVLGLIPLFLSGLTAIYDEHGESVLRAPQFVIDRQQPFRREGRAMFEGMEILKHAPSQDRSWICSPVPALIDQETVRPADLFFQVREQEREDGHFEFSRSERLSRVQKWVADQAKVSEHPSPYSVESIQSTPSGENADELPPPPKGHIWCDCGQSANKGTLVGHKKYYALDVNVETVYCPAYRINFTSQYLMESQFAAVTCVCPQDLHDPPAKIKRKRKDPKLPREGIVKPVSRAAPKRSPKKAANRGPRQTKKGAKLAQVSDDQSQANLITNADNLPEGSNQNGWTVVHRVPDAIFEHSRRLAAMHAEGVYYPTSPESPYVYDFSINFK